MADTLNLVPRLAPGVRLQDIDDDVLVFDGETLSRLTGTAVVVIHATNGVRNVRAIAEVAAASTGQPTDSLLRRVIEAVDLLVTQGTVQLDVAAPEPGYSRPAYIGVCHDEQQLVLLDLRSGQRHVLSATGAQIWQLVTATGSLPATVAELEHAFPDADGLADDAARFVADLVAKGLLERSSPRPETVIDN